MNKNKIILILTIVILAIGGYVLINKLNNQRENIGDIEVVHELGSTYVNANPEKVVVFDYGILETLDRLDINVVGVPKASLPTNLKKYNDKSITDVGTLFEPNFEVIHNLKPDLIIISGRQRDLFDELNNLAPTIFLPVDNLKFMDSVVGNLNVLSQIFTNDYKFGEHISSLEEEIDALHNIASNSTDKALILMVNSSNISALGKGSRFDAVHSLFGVKSADENIAVSTHGQNVNFEYISNINPDIIFVLDRGLITEGEGTAHQLLDNALVNGTNAAKNNKIIYLNAEAWYISTGGISSVYTMIEDVLKAYK